MHAPSCSPAAPATVGGNVWRWWAAAKHMMLLTSRQAARQAARPRRLPKRTSGNADARMIALSSSLSGTAPAPVMSCCHHCAAHVHTQRPNSPAAAGASPSSPPRRRQLAAADARPCKADTGRGRAGGRNYHSFMHSLGTALAGSPSLDLLAQPRQQAFAVALVPGAKQVVVVQLQGGARGKVGRSTAGVSSVREG